MMDFNGLYSLSNSPSEFFISRDGRIKYTFTPEVLLQLMTDGGCSQYKNTSSIPLLIDLDTPPRCVGSSGFERKKVFSVANQKLL